MKQKERHHLKENELAHSLTATRDFVTSRKRQITVTAVVVVVLVAAVLGFVIVRAQTSGRAHDLLAEAMVVVDAPVQPPNPAQPPHDGQPGTMAEQQPGTYPTEQAKLTAAIPKLKAAADAYPDAATGITARYHLASALSALGRHAEALPVYEEVITHAGTSLYARMAKLGKANEQARLGQFEPAIATYKELIDKDDSGMPADAVLMQLAAAYDASGNTDEAKKAFSRVVHEHPGSPYTTEAGKHIAGK